MVYTVVVCRNNKQREVTGTLTELIQYFGYTLLVGAQYKKSINQHPKTIDSFISNLQKAFEIKESACYDRTSIFRKI